MPPGFGGLGLSFGAGVIRLGDTNNVHNFIVRANDAPVDAPSLWIYGTAPFIIQLAGTLTAIGASALNDGIIRRATLYVNQTQCCQPLMSV